MKKLFLLLFFAAGCSSPGAKPEVGSTTFSDSMDDSSYESLLETYTQSGSLYDGFYNLFQYEATLLNTAVTEAQVARQRRFVQWNATQLQQERDKRMQEMASQTKIFLSFYVPNRQHDNLSYNDSIWKIYLDAGTRRYEGKATKISRVLSDIRSVYPFHNRWSTPYFLTFNVPTAVLQQDDSTLTITGPVGSIKVTFPKLK